jgi:hypothetical protein
MINRRQYKKAKKSWDATGDTSFLEFVLSTAVPLLYRSAKAKITPNTNTNMNKTLITASTVLIALLAQTNAGETQKEVIKKHSVSIVGESKSTEDDTEMSGLTLGTEGKQIEVRLTVPDAAYKIAIDSVYEVNKEIWVVSTVSRDPDIVGAQVISTVTATVKISVADLPVKHFVIGKTWSWENEEKYTFIKDLKQIEKDLSAGKVLYKRTK